MGLRLLEKVGSHRWVTELGSECGQLLLKSLLQLSSICACET